MSMEHISASPAVVLTAWETIGNVLYGVMNPDARMGQPIAAPVLGTVVVATPLNSTDAESTTAVVSVVLSRSIDDTIAALH